MKIFNHFRKCIICCHKHHFITKTKNSKMYYKKICYHLHTLNIRIPLISISNILFYTSILQIYKILSEFIFLISI